MKKKFLTKCGLVGCIAAMSIGLSACGQDAASTDVANTDNIAGAASDIAVEVADAVDTSADNLVSTSADGKIEMLDTTPGLTGEVTNADGVEIVSTDVYAKEGSGSGAVSGIDDLGITFEDIFGMSEEEWDKQHEQWQKESDAAHEAWEKARDAVEPRNDFDEVTYAFDDVSVCYKGAIEVQSISSTLNSMICMVSAKDSDSYAAIDSYVLKDNGEMYNKIIDCNHKHTDHNGNAYYTAKNQDDTRIYLAYPNDENSRFYCVTIVGEFDLNDFSLNK